MSTHIVTVPVYGPKGELVINQCELTAWAAKGYSTKVPADAMKKPHVTEPTMEQLRGEAAKLGIINAGKMKKEELVKVIADIKTQEKPE